MGAGPSHAAQSCLRLPQEASPDPERIARLCAALRDAGIPPAGVQVSTHGDIIFFDPIPAPGLAAGQAVRELGHTAAACAAPAPLLPIRTAAPAAALLRGNSCPNDRALEAAHSFKGLLPLPLVDAAGVTFKYDVFVSHCKRLDRSEDRAMWVVDIVQSAGLKPFFDRLDLLEISEEVLEDAVKTSRVLVTIIDPYTFESEWVVKENAWAEQYGRPIITLFDGDHHRWDQLKKWLPLHPHVFKRQAIPYTKDYRVESREKLVKQVKTAMRKPEDGVGPPSAQSGKRVAPASKTSATILSKVCIAVGKSQLAESDTAAAACAAWKQLLAKLCDAQPHLLICAYDGHYDSDLLLTTLRSLCGDGCSIVGTSSGGGIVVDGAYVSGQCIAIMGIVDPEGTYDVCFAAPGEGAEERVRTSIEAANAISGGTASSSASAFAPPFSICLCTQLFTGAHADELISGAQAALGKGCSLFGGSPLSFSQAKGHMPSDLSLHVDVEQYVLDEAASRVFASARMGSDGRPPSMHVGQGVVLALCRPGVHAASAFTSATTPMQCRGTVTKLIDRPPLFSGASASPPVTCIAEIDGRRALDVYAEWVGENGWREEFDEIVAKAKAPDESGAVNWIMHKKGEFGIIHGLGLEVTRPTCCAAKGCESEDFKHLTIFGWGPDGEAISMPGVTPVLGQKVTIMDCPEGMEGARAHTAKATAKLLHDQGFEVETIRGAFSFCCGINLLLEGAEGCEELSEKLGSVLGGAPLLGLIGGPELGPMPNGGSEFGTFMYGTVVWSDREGVTSS